MQRRLLHESLGVASGIVGTEVAVLVDVLLHGQQLRLQLVAQVRQSVADVIGQLLVQNALQVRRSHPIHQVPAYQHSTHHLNHYGRGDTGLTTMAVATAL